MAAKKRNKLSAKNLKKFLQKGQVSRLLLILAIIVLVAVVIVYLILRMADRPAAPTPETGPEVPQPVYEEALGNLKFVFESAIDKGNVLRVADISKEQYYSSWQKDVYSTERFIEVTVGAQNKGKANISDRSWDIGNIVDAEGRNFEPLDDYSIDAWLPDDNFCGALLKPEFDPIPCTKIYEVSKISTGLKITIISGKNNEANNFSSGDVDQSFLDLIVK